MKKSPSKPGSAGRPAKTKLNIAMIGCGRVAGYGHAPALAESEGLRCVAYVDLERSRAEELAKRFGGGAVYTDYRQVLARRDVDAVAILTMPTRHSRLAIEAMEAGKHVFTEKPMSDGVAGAEQMIAAARRLDRKLFVGFLLRYTGVYQKMAEIIHAGKIGRPAVYRMIGFEHYLPDQRHEWQRALRFIRDTSPAFDCGSHYVDLMRWYSGAEAIRVHGIGARINPETPPGSFDWEAFQVEFDDGSRGIYETGWGFSFPQRLCKEAIGPQGRVGVRLANLKEGHESDAETVFWTNANREKVITRSPWKGFDGEWAAFDRMIRDDLDPFPGLNDALASLRIVEAAHRSAQSGVAINLNEGLRRRRQRLRPAQNATSQQPG